jgi:hypothetical protein
VATAVLLPKDTNVRLALFKLTPGADPEGLKLLPEIVIWFVPVFTTVLAIVGVLDAPAAMLTSDSTKTNASIDLYKFIDIRISAFQGL